MASSLRNNHFSTNPFSGACQVSQPLPYTQALENDSMGVSTEARHRHCLRGSPRAAHGETFPEAPLVQQSGEVGLNASMLDGELYAVTSYDENGTSYRKSLIGTMDVPRWQPTGQNWRTELPGSPSSIRDMNEQPVFTTSISTEEFSKSPETERESLRSSESTPGPVQSPHHQIHYRRPSVPSMSPHLPSADAEKPEIPSGVEFRRVMKLRQRVQALRMQIQGQRSLVQLKQEQKSDADEKYIKMIRTKHACSPGPVQTDQSESAELERLWRLCQSARDEYGPFEDSLIAMEDRLEVEEAKLSRAEERLYAQFDLDLPKSTLQVAVSDDEDDTSSDQSSAASDQEYEPVYEDYLRRLGDEDILRERLEELHNEKQALEEEQRRRSRVGRDLASDDLQFLQQFPDTIAPVEKELDETSEDVKRLKQLCSEQGLLDAKDDLPVASDDAPALEEGDDLQHSKPSPLQTASGNNDVDSSVSVAYESFINFWLLDKLRCSTVELLILTNYVAARLRRRLEGWDWQFEALRLWYRDGAGMDMSTSAAVQTSSASSSHKNQQAVVAVKCASPQRHVGSCRSLPLNLHAKEAQARPTPTV